MEKIGDPELIRDDEVFLRMNLAERIQHIILFSTFFMPHDHRPAPDVL